VHDCAELPVTLSALVSRLPSVSDADTWTAGQFGSVLRAMESLTQPGQGGVVWLTGLGVGVPTSIRPPAVAMTRGVHSAVELSLI